MNTVLIGGNGFIGTVLSQQLLSSGHHVTSLAREAHPSVAGIKNVLIDLAHEPCPDNVFDNATTTFILLGQIHKDFDLTEEKRIVTDLALQLKQHQGHVFYFSTSMVYGTTITPAREDTPCHPYNDYSTFKREAELILQHHIPPSQLTLLRLTNIYGAPGNRGFIGLLMTQLQEDKPTLVLNGDGQQQRDFVFIDDLVSAVLAVSTAQNKPAIINIGTGVSHTLQEVVRIASRITGKTIACSNVPPVANEPSQNLVDNTKLKEDFGYDTFRSLEEGLALTYRRYQEKNE